MKVEEAAVLEMVFDDNDDENAGSEFEGAGPGEGFWRLELSGNIVLVRSLRLNS